MAGLAAATAGCFAGGGDSGLRFEPVESFASHAATQPTEFSAEQAALADAALESGAHVTYGHQPFVDGSYVEIDGRFYRADVRTTGTERLTRWVLGADLVSEPAEDAVGIDAYPAADREPVVFACRLAMARERRTPDRNGHDARYVVVFRTRSAADTTLLPEPEPSLVAYADETFRLWTEERELEEDEFRTELALVAEDRVAFRRAVESDFVIDVDALDLSSEQRDIVETAATEGEYTESGSSSAAFDGVVERLRDAAPRGNSLIEFEGQYYTWTYWHSD